MGKEILAFAEKTRKRFPPLRRSRKAGAKPRLGKLRGVKLLLADLYGTVLVANQHTLSPQHQRMRRQGFRETVKEFGLGECLRKAGAGKRPAVLLQEVVKGEIAGEHERKRKRGAESPEVRIEKIWERILRKLFKQCGKKVPKDLRLTATKAAYLSEWLHEPTGIYSGFVGTARKLKGKGITLGIASNAQFYTKINLDLALQESSSGVRKWQQLFEPRYSSFSHEVGESKPGRKLFEAILGNARKQGIERKEIAFIGNDMLKDIKIGRQLGFRTVLFAGDARSLQLRNGDRRVRGVKPDAVITEWRQLVEVVG